MKISYVKAAGFRGIKNEFSVTFPKGFVVITGRNGSGKSTICNAIEFALTGTLQDYSSNSEKGERISDYLWWRGGDTAVDRYVSVGFVDEHDKHYEITRTPDNSSAGEQGSFLSSFICAPGARDDSLLELCRTTFIRDETITKFSLDIPETERFNFVKNAIGVSDFAEIEDKVKAVSDALKRRLSKLETEYQKARLQVQSTIASVSETNVLLAKSEDIHAAETSLREVLDMQDSDASDLSNEARKKATGIRIQVEGLSRLCRTLTSLDKRRAELETREFLEQKDKLQNRVKDIESKLWYQEQILPDLNSKFDSLQNEAPSLSMLTELIELGQQVGLQHQKCPLCGCEVSQDTFNNHVADTLERITIQSRALADVVRERNEAIQSIEKYRRDFEKYTTELNQMLTASSILEEEYQKVSQEIVKLGIPVSNWNELNADYISGEIDKLRNSLSTIEKSLAVLETSTLYDRSIDLKRKLTEHQGKAHEIETQITKLNTVNARMKNISTIIKRVAGELVDEQLAALSPLFGELYYRLRPHIDWPEVSYHIRGDVRRFLSLKVGDDINPRFIFSSGQRRAAGLAFLLSVHLSRSWCNLRSLILDDPVQHIDDFRALHLVEVLAAIRKGDQQVICTVQDSDLAELLCRRLRSQEYRDGCLIEMEYSPGEGVKIADMRDINPLPTEVLLTA
jgi:DNA repair exonuclease SbcCD ATPase subunit